jgi:hypothetical protein
MSVISSSNRLDASDASTQVPSQPVVNRSIHRWAMVMVCMTFPLIWVGGLVTTYDAGMAVPDWPGTYGYNLFLYPISTWLFGPFDLFVEHGHRLLASLVGLMAIGFLYAVMRYETRPWMKVWAVFMLAAVISQGLLGGFRVLKDARAMAMIHGCTASAFFGLAAATAVMTSPWWIAAGQTAVKNASSRASKVPGVAQETSRRKGRLGILSACDWSPTETRSALDSTRKVYHVGTPPFDPGWDRNTLDFMGRLPVQIHFPPPSAEADSPSHLSTSFGLRSIRAWLCDLDQQLCNALARCVSLVSSVHHPVQGLCRIVDCDWAPSDRLFDHRDFDGDCLPVGAR